MEGSEPQPVSVIGLGILRQDVEEGQEYYLTVENLSGWPVIGLVIEVFGNGAKWSPIPSLCVKYDPESIGQLPGEGIIRVLRITIPESGMYMKPGLVFFINLEELPNGCKDYMSLVVRCRYTELNGVKFVSGETRGLGLVTVEHQKT